MDEKYTLIFKRVYLDYNNLQTRPFYMSLRGAMQINSINPLLPDFFFVVFRDIAQDRLFSSTDS